MKRNVLCTRFPALLLVSLTLMTACGKTPASSAQSRTPTTVSSTAQNTARKLSTAQEILVTEQAVPMAAPVPWELYAQAVPEAAFSHPLEESFDDRHFKLNKAPDNALEALVAEQFYCQIAADFDAYAALLGETEIMQITAHNLKVSFDESAYVTEYLVNDISVLTQDDITEIVPVLYELEHQAVQQNELTSFAVVRAKISLEYSAGALARSGHSGVSSYLRYYLCGTTQDDPEWKIYAFYSH